MNDDNLILLPGVAHEPEAAAPDESPLDALPSEEAAPVALDKPAPHLVPAVVEALLLASDRPLTVDEIDRVLKNPGEAIVLTALRDFQERLWRQAGGIRLVEVAKGWQLRTDVRAGPWVAAFRGGKPVRLSKAALETLSVIAYRQPVTRGEIEGLRGVDSGGVLRMLCERGVVAASGRADEPGRPLYYCTTGQFLELFGLRDLSDLPTLRDLRELKQDDPREMLGDPDAGTHDPDEDAPIEGLPDEDELEEEPPVEDEAPTAARPDEDEAPPEAPPG